MRTQTLIHHHLKAISTIITLTALFLLCLTAHTQATGVHEEGGKTYIVDQKGERWEITQAIELGFRPEGFQFGIGRYAIRPLDDQHLGTKGTKLPGQSRVIGVSTEESAHAYSVGRLTRHEIANTHLGNTPIAAAYWPLVDLAAVYRRQLNGQALTLAPSGWTYDFTFVLVDRETGSLWYPNDKGLKAIQGPHFGSHLEKMPSTDTQWNLWQDDHPESRVLPWVPWQLL